MKDYYLIGEVAANHNGDLQVIKKLIDACFSIGWDCVKFQKRTPKLCIPLEQQFKYVTSPWGELRYIDYRNKLELTKEQFDYIDYYCKEKPIEWSSSVWDLPSLEFILQYNVPFIKIPSAKLTDYELVEESAKSGKKIIISTGMSTIEEIDKAVQILKRNAKEFILLHTNSAYPSPIEDINLNVIHFLINRYCCEVGYSGHEDNLEPTVASYVLGAKYIERHITLDHNMWGTDQKSSLELQAMDILKRRLDCVSMAMGNGVKIVTEEERKIKNKLRG
jgi:N-acetylneuraminate synthase